MLGEGVRDKSSSGDVLDLVPLGEQVSGILSDIQNAAIKAHLLSLSVGNNSCDKKLLDTVAEQFCSLASQAATGISYMDRILEIMQTITCKQ